jgi:serine/threonine-protein kinase
MLEEDTTAWSPSVIRVPAAEIQAQLELICSSPQFIKSERMNRFLRFVVEQALQGNGDDLKEYTIGVEVFDKDASFDPRIDNNVRTEARRLRAKLAEYYATYGLSDKVRIELPKGSYCLVSSRPRRSSGLRHPKSPCRKRRSGVPRDGSRCPLSWSWRLWLRQVWSGTGPSAPGHPASCARLRCFHS